MYDPNRQRVLVCGLDVGVPNREVETDLGKS